MMGRKKTRDLDLPARLQLKNGAYHYRKGNKSTKLCRANLDENGKPSAAARQRALEMYAAIDGPAGTMPALIQRVLAHHRGKVSANTVAQYETAAKIISHALAEFTPGQVRPRDVAQIKVDMASTPNMANRCLSFLRLVFSYALEWGEVDSNPVIGIRRHAEKKRNRYITDAEYRAIYQTAPDRLQVVMDLLYFSGQRIGDVLAIRRTDLVDAGIEFRQQKTGAKLTIKWSPPLEAAVARAKRLQTKVQAMTLLSGRTGKAPDYRTVREQWDKACARAGIEDAHIHDLRAKSLTDAKREGLDAQALAGHASAAMTARYIRLRESLLVAGPSRIRDSCPEK